MGIKKSLVVLKHDEGYGDDLLEHINIALRGKDMIAVSATPIGLRYIEDALETDEITGDRARVFTMTKILFEVLRCCDNPPLEFPLKLKKEIEAVLKSLR